MEKPEIIKGSVVRYGTGWKRVHARFKNHVNLGGIFGSRPTIKRVPLDEVEEDYDGWSACWATTEAYKCM